MALLGLHPATDLKDPLIKRAYFSTLTTLPELAAIPQRYRDLALPKRLRAAGLRQQLKLLALPRIFAVWHEDRFLERTLEVLRALPHGSKIGLEGNEKLCYVPGYPAASAAASKNNFFSKLAEDCRSRGHTIVWLERSVSALGASWKDSAVFGPDGDTEVNLPRYNFQEVRILTSLWRSCVQSRTVLAQSWQSTDVVIVGTLHGLHLASFWQRPLTALIDFGAKTLEERIVFWRRALSTLNNGAALLT